MVAWRAGKFLVWDAMCIDIFAPSYKNLAVQAAGAVAAKAESLKEEKYSDMFNMHEFVPIAMESPGVLGPHLLAFVKELGRNMWYQTGERKTAAYLIQCLSIAVQWGNAISVVEGLGIQRCT